MNKQRLLKAIKRIAWGYILLHFNINIMTINIMPDWAGLWLILSALPILDEEIPTAHLLTPLGRILMIWEGITWLLAIIGISVNIMMISLIMGCISLYFHFQLLTNLVELADKYYCPQKNTLLILRTIRTILTTILVLPVEWMKIEWLAFMIIIIQVIVMFWLCMTLFGLKKSLIQYQEEINAA